MKMEQINKLHSSIWREINQDEILQKNLIVYILCSRRLLGDHCDLLEEAISELEALDQQPSNVVNLLNTAGVVATCSLAFLLTSARCRYLAPAISGIAPVMYMNKLVNSYKRAFLESQMKEFIKALDDFEYCFKKIQTFFNDATIMEHHAKILERYNKDDQVAVNLVYTIKRVIRALYCFLKYIEAFFKIDLKFQCIYTEVDDVDNCELMSTEHYDYAASKTYKDLFSLYAFVQSQLLLRLALVFATNAGETKFVLRKKLPDMTSKIKTQTKLLPNFLDVSKYTPKLKQNVQKQINEELAKAMPKELIHIRTTTIEFALKALTFALQSQELEQNISCMADNHKNPIKKDVDNVLNNMETLESQIAMFGDEQSRLMILIKKYLNNNKEEKEEKTDETKEEDSCAESNVTKVVNGDETPLPQKDEFFYLDPSTEAEDDEEKKSTGGDMKTPALNKADSEEEDVQIKRTKKCFKPVLQQLKERIVPIEEDMKQREKKSLKAKGIEIPEDETNSEEKRVSWAEEEDGSDDEWQYVTDRKKKRQDKKARKYEVNRDFLKSKQQLNLIKHIASNPIPTPFSNPRPAAEEFYED